DRQQPEDDGAMTDHRDQHLDGVLVPLLDGENEEREDHRSTNEMTVKIAPKRDGPRNMKNELVQLGHHVVPLGILRPTRSAFTISRHRCMLRRSKASRNWAQLIVHYPPHLDGPHRPLRRWAPGRS